MRALILFSVVFFALANLNMPALAMDDTECDYVRILTRILEERRINLFVGVTEKQNARLGDNVSVALLKLYNEDELRNSENIRLYLPVIRASFPHLDKGETLSHRHPNVTLFFLHWLVTELKDRQLRGEVLQLIKYLENN